MHMDRRMKSRIAIGTVIALLAVAIVATFYMRESDGPPVIASHTRASEANELPDSAVANAGPADGSSTATPVASSPPAAKPTLQQQFTAASDYHDFARSLLDAARGGD